MKDNLEILDYGWDVPQEAKKPISGGRLNGKTDISPMWRIRKLTEIFGPCGIGWWYTIKEQRLLEGADGEIKAFVTIDLFYRWGEQVSQPVPGVGGNTFVERGGKYTSDECFKMALTDAISVAAKALGIGGAVYSGEDRTKYSGRETPPPPARAQSAHPRPLAGEARPATEQPAFRREDNVTPFPSRQELPPVQAQKFTCDCCGRELRPYTDSQGRNVSLRAHAERSMQKFGKVLCLDCMPR